MIPVYLSRVRHFLRRTRIVPSGSPPLYRLMLVSAFISSVIQAVIGDAPQSISTTGPSYLDIPFIGVQLVGSSMALVSLYMVDESAHHATKLHRSLSWEFVGLWLVQTVIFTHVLAIMLFNAGPPAALSSWFEIAFWVWTWFHLREIWLAMRELRA